MPAGWHDRAAQLDTRRLIGDLFRTMGPFAPPPPPGAQQRPSLEITAFAQPGDHGEHFKAYYGPTIAARANAERNDRAEEFDAALEAFCDKWNQSSGGPARFENEYLLSVGNAPLKNGPDHMAKTHR
jgi:hypothetical protein